MRKRSDTEKTAEFTKSLSLWSTHTYDEEHNGMRKRSDIEKTAELIKSLSLWFTHIWWWRPWYETFNTIQQKWARELRHAKEYTSAAEMSTRAETFHTNQEKWARELQHSMFSMFQIALRHASEGSTAHGPTAHGTTITTTTTTTTTMLSLIHISEPTRPY